MQKKHREFTIQSHYSSLVPAIKRRIAYPSLKMAGKWMADCGFRPQDKVRVIVCREVLIIELIK